MRKSPSGERNNVDIIQTIRQKLLDSRIKVAQILHKCENIDKNGDGLIHTDDLEDIFNETVGSEYRITRRELLKLVGLISNERSNGKVEYEKIFDLIEPPKKKEYKKADENWKDEGVEDGDTRWATQPGSVGEWLKKSACPAEIKNFKIFVSCLEKYERDSGVKINLKEDGGFICPLGPDLRASISFFMQP